MNETRKGYWLKRLGAGVLLIGMMAVPVGVSWHFNGIQLSPEAMDCAQLARNLARGRGYVTAVIRPASLLFSDRLSGHPDLYQPPLATLLLAAVFRVYGASDRVVALWALLLFWTAGLLAVLLARRALGRGAGWLCAALYFTNAPLLNSVLDGDSSLLESVILLGILALLYRMDKSPAAFLMYGLLCGVGYLASYGVLWFGLAVLIGVFFTLRPVPALKTCSFLVAGFILPLLFGWWRLGYLMPPLRAAEFRIFTSIFPGDSLWRETGWEVFRRGVGLKTLILKWWQGGESIYESLLFFTGSFAVVFFWPALFLPFADRGWSRVRYLIFGCLLLAAGQFIICARRPQDIRFLIPAALPMAVAAFCFLLEKMNLAGRTFRKFLIGVFIGLNLIPAIDQLRISRPPRDPTRDNCLRLRDWVAAGEGVVTDRPEAVAWYGGRIALWLPAEGETSPGWRYLYMTPVAADYPPVRAGNRVISWPRVYRTGGRFPFWEVEEFLPLPGDQFFCRIAARRPPGS